MVEASFGGWLTDEGYPFTKVVPVYGKYVAAADPLRATEDGAAFSAIVLVPTRLVSASSEEHRAACEARAILAKPSKEERNSLIKKVATKRCSARGAAAVEIMAEELRAAVLWEWHVGNVLRRQRADGPNHG